MPLTPKNSTTSWWAGRLRRWRKVHCRLPTQENRVATAPEMILAVVTLSESTVCHSRLARPMSMTNAIAPTTPNLIISR